MNRTPKTPTEIIQHNPELGTVVSRRTILKGLGVLATLAAVPEAVRPVATIAGEAYDTLASLETLLTPQALIPLEPRETDVPIVEAQPIGEPTPITTRYIRGNETAVLHFDDPSMLRAEHTNMPIEDTNFTAAGTAIITTAEGLEKGEQAYSQLFTSETRTIAVGYEGGIYTFELALAHDGTKGEWVRVVTNNENGETSAVTSTTPWEKLEAKKPASLLIKEVTAGTETLRELGYKPFNAILASTRMPDEKESYFAPEDCAQTPEEVAERTKPFFLSKEGVIIDLHHLEAKAHETLGLYIQLLAQQVNGEAHPTATVRYSGNSEAPYTFAVEASSLAPDTIADTTFSVMNAVTTLMEGVSQRYLLEKAPALSSLSSSSGMSHEDMYTNTLGVSGMLARINEHGLADKLRYSVQNLHAQYPDMTPEDMVKVIIEELPIPLVPEVIERTAETHGVQSFDTPIIETLPRGLYPLIPVKVNPEDTASPTPMTQLLREANVKVNNPKVKIVPTHVTAMQSTAGHVLGKVGL